MPDNAPETGSLLVVDDEEMNRDMLSRRLIRRGYEATCAVDGYEALKLIESRQFDLVLLDVMMPGINGIDVLKTIRQTHEPARLPIIMVTALGDSDHIVAALDAGANDYVTKPVDIKVALARVRTHLMVKRAMEALDDVNARLFEMATIDTLTGIPNRRRFEQVLDSEWKRGLRDGDLLSLLVMDVDHFKKFNDTYGHDVGDLVLKEVAKALAVTSRPADVVARYGGEEFVAILPQTDIEGAKIVAERLRERIEKLEIDRGDGQTTPVTISIGAVCRKIAADIDPASLITLADGALYEAKRNGRNQVQSAA